MDSMFNGNSPSHKPTPFLCLTPTGAKTSRQSKGFSFDFDEEKDSKALVNSGVLFVEDLEPGKLIIKDLETQATSASEGEEETNLNARRPVIEEYFGLTVLSVKLNSPYMESVCGIENKFLYKEAQKQMIPFHKWHGWVDEYLTEEYINSFYTDSADSKNKNSKSPKKKK